MLDTDRDGEEYSHVIPLRLLPLLAVLAAPAGCNEDPDEPVVLSGGWRLAGPPCERRFS